MKAEELDRKFDDGEDVLEYFDISTLRRPGLETKRVNLDTIDENEPKAVIIADLQESIRQARAGQTYPISELWDDKESR